MAETIVMGCVPADVTVPADILAGRDWTTVEHPPTDDDGPVTVVHVIKFAEEGAASAMAGYHVTAARIAAPHGVRVAGVFDVEGTILGDGRTWDQVRFNVFPSKRAFMAVLADPARIEAQQTFRSPAIADTYTLIVRAGINQLPGMAS